MENARQAVESSLPATSTPAPKAFYSSLDALRGLAAFAVMFFHLANWMDVTVYFPRGDLAVDFFFCLSGFVMAHAYGKRIGTAMSFPQFATTRLIRLYPLMALSIVIAAVYFFAKSAIGDESVPTSDILGASISALFVLPYFGNSAELGGTYEVFPINGPLWSLFYELVINFAWAAAFAFLTFRRTLFLAIICALALTIGGVLHSDLLLGDRTTDFLWGVPRVGVSFAAGLLVYELHTRRIVQRRLPFWLLACALIVPMTVPRIEGQLSGVFFDAAFIFVLTPITVLLAAKVEQSGRWLKLSKFGGELSYPIYVLHFPLFIWVNGAVEFFALPLQTWALMTLFALVIAVGSWLALVWFDRPARRLLNVQRKNRICTVTGQVKA